MIYDRNHRRCIRVQNIIYNDIIVYEVYYIIIMTLWVLRFTVLLLPHKRR